MSISKVIKPVVVSVSSQGGYSMSKGEKLVSHSNTLYNHMFSHSEVITLEENSVIRVWKGSVVNTSLELGIPYGSYGACIRALTAIGSIQIVKRGARNNPSVVALLAEPTEELWASFNSFASEALTKRTRAATLTAEAERIIATLGGADIGKVLKNFEDRITALETAQGLKKGKRTNGKTS